MQNHPSKGSCSTFIKGYQANICIAIEVASVGCERSQEEAGGNFVAHGAGLL